MKLSGTTALYAQLKELQTAVAVTEKQIAMAEELEAPKPEKKTRRKRTPKVPEEVIGKPNGYDDHNSAFEA